MKRKYFFLLMAAALVMGFAACSEDEFTVDGLKYKVTSESPKTVELTGYDGEKPTGALEIPATVKGYGVTSIGYNAFSSCEELTSVTIPEGVTSIGEDAFAYCVGLTSITLSDNLKYIGEAAFYYCIGLPTVSIPASVTSIDNLVFAECYNLTSVTIPDGVTRIRQGTFRNCSALTSFIIPANVTNIQSFAFEGCTNITDVYCYADLETLIWEGPYVGFNPYETKFHVKGDIAAWKAKFRTPKVIFVGDLN